MKDLHSVQLFMLDMDGTVYNENELIPGAEDFFALLKMQERPYVFMTNNSSRSKSAYVEKLSRLGIPATEKQIASSVNATIRYLKEHKPFARLYLVGTQSLKSELEGEGFSVVPADYRGRDVDYVLVGFDTELTYQKIEGACYFVSRGTEFIATNCDIKCPVKERKFIPDCGAIAAMIENATGRKPLFLGKPDKAIVDLVSGEWNIPVSDIACVGDRLYTDIAVANNAGATSICVLTGEATKSEIAESAIKCDYVFDSIKELYEELKRDVL